MPLDEIAILEQALRVPTSAYEVVDFEKQVGTTEAIIDEIADRLLRIKKQYPKYNELRKLAHDSIETKEFIVELVLDLTEIRFIYKTFKIACELMGEEEFHTMTGFHWRDAQKLLKVLSLLDD